MSDDSKPRRGLLGLLADRCKDPALKAKKEADLRKVQWQSEQWRREQERLKK